MNIENNNTLIAEFMQVEVQDEVYFILPQFPYCNQLTDYNTYDFYKKETLEYHKNWNWLMEVVEKIEQKENEFSFYISDKSCTITGFEVYGDLRIFSVGGSKIESVYKACLEFIKWYNQNK